MFYRAKKEKYAENSSHVGEAAQHLLIEAKKLASGIYEEGKDKLDEFQVEFKQYSDQINKKVHEKPITSLLIVGGIGLLLLKLLRR